MFLNDLFTIDKIDFTSETISADIILHADHKIFDGHFPGSPVTPGVIQLQIVKEILEVHFNRELHLKTMRTSKFLKILNPMETPHFQINIKFLQEDFLEVAASGSQSGDVYFKAQMSYL